MINIVDKKLCCACSACVQKCPKHSIIMYEDDEGFSYPLVNQDTCIKCGLCEKVCPMLLQAKKIEPQKVLAAKNTCVEERMNSSSGGVFLLLAKEVIKQGGVVFGAVYDEKWEVHHVYATKIEDVYPMMGSKYVQSRVENSYREAEKFLKQGQKVMFVGSPCQIAGFRAFLRNKEYDNLLAIDFVCHGVPSPGVWRRYLAETYSNSEMMVQYRRQAAGKNSVLFSSLNAKSPIGDIKFRDKTESGWKKFRFVVRQKSASKADQNTVLSSDIHYMNVYMKGFLNNIYLRPSCYSCKCKNGVNHSDLTLADFWGINTINPSFDDDKGCSLVLINSERGNAIFESLKLETWKSDLKIAKQFNPGFGDMIPDNPFRKRFFRMFNRGMTVEKSIQKCYSLSFMERCKLKIKRILKKILK